MSSQTQIKRITVSKISAHKGAEPLVCLTAYTAPMARLLDDHADLLLVGDSVAMVLHGMDSTIGVTLEHMIMHGQAVMRGSKKALVVIDMPFGTYEESPQIAFRNASRLMQETGCTAVKFEGGTRMAETIFYLTERGVPVMGHIGLMPQLVNVKGGYRVVGRRSVEWSAVEADARAVEEAGAFCVVLEGIAEPLAKKITKLLTIPTVGIGASPTCDGQILVTDDLLGLSEHTPSFVKKYADLRRQIGQAGQAYASDVRARRFPGPDHVYGMKLVKDKKTG